MRNASIFLALALMTAGLSAQTRTGDLPAVYIAPLSSAGCPIGITAERYGPVSVATVGVRPVTSDRHGLQLHFEHLLAPRIDQVTVVVHGLSAKGRVLPADALGGSNIQETFHLARWSLIQTLTEASLQFKSIQTAQWLELTSVQYADGSSWRPSNESQCRVAPSNFMLVTKR